MNTHHTKIELCGEEYTAVILFEWDTDEWEGKPLIHSVIIKRSVNEFYDAAGRYKKTTKILSVEILPMMSDEQLVNLADEITANCCEEDIA